MKRITALVIITTVMLVFTGCGDDKDTSSTKRSRHESTLTEETLVEEINVEEINVEEIQVNEITWDSGNVTRWN